MAALRALKFGLEVGIDKAIVEGDLELVVVKALIKEDKFGLIWFVDFECL